MSKYTDLLIEDMNSKFNAVIEALAFMRDEIKGMATAAQLEEVKQDVKVIKAAVTDLSKTVNNHEKRITIIESVVKP